MTDLRSILTSMTALSAAFALTGCGGEPPEDPEASPYAGGEPAAEESEAAAPAGGDAPDSDALSALEIAAREVCAAGDEGFAAELPEGSAFASRGPDARVHAAWNVDGETHETIIHTPSLGSDAKLAFDGAVADFIRRNLVAGFDRTGLTGAFRYRDGRFCVVQTEAEAIAPFQAAVREAEAALEGSEG